MQFVFNMCDSLLSFNPHIACSHCMTTYIKIATNFLFHEINAALWIAAWHIKETSVLLFDIRNLLNSVFDVKNIIMQYAF